MATTVGTIIALWSSDYEVFNAEDLSLYEMVVRFVRSLPLL